MTIRDLLRNALRMRPDRIVIGEVRGAEALDLLTALNTGHDGALSTVHANSPEDALRRIETLALMAGVGLPHEAIREQLARGIDLVVHLARLGDGSRRVVEVSEVVRSAGSVGVRELLPVVIVLAALAGGLVAVAAREAVLGVPQLLGWLSAALRPLARAEREGYAPTAEEQRRLAGVGSGAILVLALLAAGPGPLAVLAAAGPATATWLVSRRRERYRRAVERSIPAIASAIADAISGGRSIRAALVAASSSLQGPPSAELARIGADLELGQPTAAALESLRRRLGSPRVDALVTALLSQQAAGGDVAALMRRLGAASAQHDRAADDARAATAQARFTGLLVVALPVGATLFAELVQPGFISRVLADPAATAMLVLAAALQLAGFAAIRRFGRAEE